MSWQQHARDLRKIVEGGESRLRWGDRRTLQTTLTKT